MEHVARIRGGGVDLRLFWRSGSWGQSSAGRANVEPVGGPLRRRDCLHHALQRPGAWGGFAAVVLFVGPADEFVNFGSVWTLGVSAAIDRGPTSGWSGVGGRRGGFALASTLVCEVDNQRGVVGGFSNLEFCMGFALIAVHLDLRDATVQALRKQGVINTQSIIFRES